MERVLVTGANGFVGQTVCRALKEAGFAVRGTVRSAKKVPAPLSKDETVIVEDIGPDTVWEPILENVDAVVHLGGRVHLLREVVKDPQAEFLKVNVQGTERLTRAAANAGVRRFVYISSIGVNGKVTLGRPFTEEDVPSPYNSYALSKWKAEQALHRVAEETGLESTILRPPLMYGPGVKANFLRLMKLVDRGLPIPLGSVDNRRSLLYVGNLADAVRICIEHPNAAGKTFLLSDGEDISTPELIRRIAHAIRRPVRLLPFPPSLLRAAGLLTRRSSSVEPLLDSLAVDSGKIRYVLGWRSPHTVTEGLEDTARWLRSTG